MEHVDLVSQIDSTLRETFALWDPGWVTFNWRAYTYDHTRRVTGLALTLCEREGGDALVTELAALLHDITKPYDGEYVVGPDGKRLVDERGLWYNQVRRPVRSNHVTALYDQLALEGKLHNESGALLAHALLSELGVDQRVCNRVAETIAHHLMPPADAPIESACLYDADTIDANIGLPAFVRNIYIHHHYYDQRRAPDAPSIAEILQQRPLEYLVPYIRENLPNWAEGKRRDFVPRLHTQAGRDLANLRIDRLEAHLGWLSDELDLFAAHPDHTGVDVVVHYMTHTDDPSVAEETRHLLQVWAPAGASPRTCDFIADIQRECQGVF
ncbi:MAG: HD domain-containing protein [Anaerolineae bacterium]|jgi:putative nucleotidyltransferase with HDIG domain|nr:HD domain-containing protein [Chloroflexota bacterium]